MPARPYRELIDEALGRGRNARAIWQDLVDDHGFTAGYASVRRFVRQVRGASTPEARVVIVTAAGEEAQVDYGEGPMVRPPGGGKYRRTRLFVLTLGYSRKAVYLLTWQSSAQIWATLHEQAFRRLGGAPRVLVLDNLREGVLTPDVYDPTINPLYRDVLTHYGVTALPCRVRDPDRKGKVERSVGHAKQTPLKGPALRVARRGAGLSRSVDGALGRHAHPRHDEAAGRRDVCRGAARAAAAARHAVSLLPVRHAHRPSRWLRRGRGRVLLGAARLDRPAGAGAVDRRASCACSRSTGSCCASMSAGPAAITASLTRIGPPRRRRRRWRCWRVRDTSASRCTRSARTSTRTRAPRAPAASSARSRSTKRYGPVAVEDAAKAALELRVPTYRFLRRYLERRPPLTLRQVDPLIRQLTVYRDLIDRTTGDPT